MMDLLVVGSDLRKDLELLMMMRRSRREREQQRKRAKLNWRLWS